MTTELKCVCCHLREAHEAIDGECGVPGCTCASFRPVHDWPDAVGWWWSKALRQPVFFTGSHVRRLGVEGDYSRLTWIAAFGGPDQFTKCEPNPFTPLADWALNEPAKLVLPDDDAPEVLRQRAAANEEAVGGGK